jgi:hypothetical protein
MHQAAAGVLVGVFDLFNVEHLDALVAAADRCEDLTVAVLSDDLAAGTGRRRPFVPETERLQIVGAVRGVARVSVATSLPAAVRGAELVLTLDSEDLAPVVRAAVADAPLEVLTAGRATASTAVRAALAGSTGAAGATSVA